MSSKPALRNWDYEGRCVCVCRSGFDFSLNIRRDGVISYETQNQKPQSYNAEEEKVYSCCCYETNALMCMLALLFCFRKAIFPNETNDFFETQQQSNGLFICQRLAFELDLLFLKDSESMIYATDHEVTSFFKKIPYVFCM